MSSISTEKAREEYRAGVLNAIARVVGNPPLGDIESDHTRLEDLGLDSLSLVVLAEEIEREFGIVIADEDFDMANFQTLGTVVRLLEIYAPHINGIERR